jgi:tRNA threonylcarbamoyladenosine biosynthesis protein TsaB
MRVLALDTSTEHLSLALLIDGEILVRETRAGQRHSELTLPMLEVLLVEAGVGLRGLDGLAFGQGPGSFTGIRIACGIAQGLAFGADLPVVGIPTLLALAAQADHDRVIACLDARMNEVYHAAYQRIDEEWHEIHAPGLYAAQAAPAVLGQDWLGIGSGFKVADGALRRQYAQQVSAVWDERQPHAREIAQLGARRLAQGQGVPPWQAAPLYIRDKVALKTSER